MRMEEDENDHFDRLPDALLRLIFNKLHDAQSLSRSMSVCKRFASIIPEVDNVFLKFPLKSLHQSHDQVKNSNTGDGGSKHIWKSLIRKVIVRPLQFLLQIIAMKSSSSLSDDLTDFSDFPTNGVLKSFKEIQSLRIELPGHGGEIGSQGADSILKWRAEFGKELESCVIVGARSLTSKNPNCGEENDEQQRDQDLLPDDELKMRVVWAISCLIAASARHYMLQQVVSDHPMLRSVVVSDGSKQGRLSMRTEQVEDLRSNVTSAAQLESSPSPDRTPVPALKMKLWHVPVLELPVSGCVMKGATLLVIRPVYGANAAERDGDLVGRVWDGEEEVEEAETMMFGEAAGEMMKNKKTYTLEMNSF